MARVIAQSDFVWRGLALHFGQRDRPVLTLVQDATYSHLYRIRYLDGWTSEPGNLTRAKDAAYGHARYLLREETGGSNDSHFSDSESAEPESRAIARHRRQKLDQLIANLEAETPSDLDALGRAYEAREQLEEELAEHEIPF